MLTLRFVFPVLHVPGHVAPGADGISFQLGAKAIAILEEIDVILHGVLLDELGKLAGGGGECRSSRGLKHNPSVHHREQRSGGHDFFGFHLEQILGE